MILQSGWKPGLLRQDHFYHPLCTAAGLALFQTFNNNSTCAAVWRQRQSVINLSRRSKLVTEDVGACIYLYFSNVSDQRQLNSVHMH